MVLQYCVSVWIVLIALVQNSFPARLPDKHYVCTYDPVTGHDLCKEDVDETSTQDVCDYRPCYNQWTSLLSTVHFNVSRGVPIETDVMQWLTICDNSAMEVVQMCVTEVANQCTNNLASDEVQLSLLTNFCQFDGLKTYILLQGVQCHPRTDETNQCQHQAEVQMSMANKKFNSAKDQLCLFQRLFRDCFRRQLMELCGENYLNFYDFTQKVQWDEMTAMCNYDDNNNIN